MGFVKVSKVLSDREALDLYYALKQAGTIKGNEYFSFQKERAQSPIHLNLISKRAKADYVRSLKPDFFKKAKLYTSLSDLAEKVYQRSLQNGGSTTYVDTGIAVTTGFLVAGLGALEWIGTTLTPDIIEEYISKVYDSWFKDSNNVKRYFLGTWLNKQNNKWYLDVSQDAGSEQAAIALCKERNEVAYYDMLKSTDVYIDSL